MAAYFYGTIGPGGMVHKREALLGWRICIVLIALTVFPLVAAVAARGEGAIQPQGKGVLRICRYWDMTSRTCRDYHHIALPASIHDGDTFRVEYGSNPKSYDFTVGHIKVKDGMCSIYRAQQDQPEDRVKVACTSDSQ